MNTENNLFIKLENESADEIQTYLQTEYIKRTKTELIVNKRYKKNTELLSPEILGLDLALTLIDIGILAKIISEIIKNHPHFFKEKLEFTIKGVQKILKIDFARLDDNKYIDQLFKTIVSTLESLSKIL